MTDIVPTLALERRPCRGQLTSAGLWEHSTYSQKPEFRHSRVVSAKLAKSPTTVWETCFGVSRACLGIWSLWPAGCLHLQTYAVPRCILHRVLCMAAGQFEAIQNFSTVILGSYFSEGVESLHLNTKPLFSRWSWHQNSFGDILVPCSTWSRFTLHILTGNALWIWNLRGLWM